MKKIALLLALVMVIGLLAGCGGGTNSTTDAPSQPDVTPSTAPSTVPSTAPSTPSVEYAPEGITLLSCRFDQEVTAQDREYTAMLYADRANQVYVDMCFYVSPKFFEGGKTLPHFAAEVTYDEHTYELEYTIETAANTSFEKAGVPTTGGYVHMITSLPEEVMDQDGLEVRYSIGDEQYTCQVGPIVTEGKLDNKTELTVGFQDTVYGGTVDIEVVDIRCQEYLLATQGGEDDRYGWLENSFERHTYVDVILKITNNFTSESLYEPLGYMIEGNSMTRTACRVETDHNTKLEYLTSIEPGQTAYIHMFATIDDSSDEVGLRINFGGKLYYCTIANTVEKEPAITVHAYTPDSWSDPSCWAWKDGGDNVFSAWPGCWMTETDGRYTIKLPAWVDYVIINGNDGSIQTADIPVEPGKDVWIVIHPDSTDYSLFYQQPTADELAALGY